MCGGNCSLWQGTSQRVQVWSEKSFLSFVKVSGMQPAGRSKVQVASVSWERQLWNQIKSCTFTSKYWRTFMNHPGMWFPSQQHWFVPRWQKMPVTSPVTFPLTILMTSEEYSGSLEAAMSENHPTSSSVKWEVLLSLCVILSWMQFAGHSHVQVASVNEKGSFQNQITSRTLTSRYVLVPDTWDRFKQTHSQQPGGENVLEHYV